MELELSNGQVITPACWRQLELLWLRGRYITSYTRKKKISIGVFLDLFRLYFGCTHSGNAGFDDFCCVQFDDCVDALIDARILESMSVIKHHAIDISGFDSSDMYHAGSRALPVMLHWCWGAREDRVLHRRNGCLVGVMNCYKLPVDQDSMIAELTAVHEGLKIYHGIRGHTLSDNFLDAIGMSAHTRHG